MILDAKSQIMMIAAGQKFLFRQNGKIRATEIMMAMHGIVKNSHIRATVMKKWFC